MDDDSMSAELKMFNKLEKEAEILEKSTPLTKCPSEEDVDHTGVYEGYCVEHVLLTGIVLCSCNFLSRILFL